MTIEDMVKLLTVLHSNQRDDIVARELDRLSTAELRDALTIAVRLLADARIELKQAS